MFQSTRPRGRTRLPSRVLSLRFSGFNPRVLAGGRDIKFNGLQSRASVSIHASSREDATRERHAHTIFESGFNPRVLAGGRDRAPQGHLRSGHVSIHASSREDATWFLIHDTGIGGFQSTRPRGRTRPLNLRILALNLSFNPRVLAGGRDAASSLPFRNTRVSIHASSREDATS